MPCLVSGGYLYTRFNTVVCLLASPLSNILSKWMIWGYPWFSKFRCVWFTSMYLGQLTVSIEIHWAVSRFSSGSILHGAEQNWEVSTSFLGTQHAWPPVIWHSHGKPTNCPNDDFRWFSICRKMLLRSIVENHLKWCIWKTTWNHGINDVNRGYQFNHLKSSWIFHMSRGFSWCEHRDLMGPWSITDGLPIGCFSQIEARNAKEVDPVDLQ